jgi:conjugative transfer signal peptidase TraF
MSKRAILIAGTAGLTAIVAPIAMPTTPRLIWNATASVPVGLYRLHPRPRLQRGIIVAVNLPAGIARLAASREYLPVGVPLLKPVAALEGDFVCRAGDTVFVGGKAIGRARARDWHGRPLPHWNGCAWLGPGDVFVMNPAVPDSFDGRYFGVLPASSIIGRATPVWLAGVHAIPSSRTAEERNDGTDR